MLAWVLGWSVLVAQPPKGSGSPDADTDRDGLSDALEQKLLVQFLPTYMISDQDCSGLPAEFRPNSLAPQAEADNGTVYGQAFPAHPGDDGSPVVELHYYDLWRSDCGAHGHPLDTEHVAVLVKAADIRSAQWKASYWYAAAHENTVCDVSQIARASTVQAEDHGATVWISPGKHASYLEIESCQRGCGADHCARMTRLAPAKVINLGEPGRPMNGSEFISSKAWPLGSKMSTSNFPEDAIARLNELPGDEIAAFRPGRHPVQGVIATSSSTEQALATSGANTSAAVGAGAGSTGDALSTAASATGGALSVTTDDTGNSLKKTYKRTWHALGTSVRHVGQALHLAPKDEADGH
jgi:hypothetical protein